MGERLPCKQEVEGSIPSRSTDCGDQSSGSGPGKGCSPHELTTASAFTGRANGSVVSFPYNSLSPISVRGMEGGRINRE